MQPEAKDNNQPRNMSKMKSDFDFVDVVVESLKCNFVKVKSWKQTQLD